MNNENGNWQVFWLDDRSEHLPIPLQAEQWLSCSEI